MSRGSCLVGLVPLLFVVGCATAPAIAPAAKSSALPELLAALACPEVDGRVLTLSTANDGILDAFAYVKDCHAASAGAVTSAVTLDGDAWIWVAVDRDLGPLRVRQFVHASLSAQLGLGVMARYENDRLVLTLAPRDPRASIEPVGALEVSPLNWASLLAVELAPATGTSVELVAKRRLQKETEAAIASALATPFVFSYDARRGEVSGPASQSGKRVRVVPRGTALLGPYPEAGSAPDVRLTLPPGARVATRLVCRSHAERLLEADRRGDVVGLEDWTPVDSAARPSFGSPPCPWFLALRAVDDAGAIATVDIHAKDGDGSAHERAHRWVALDELALVSGEVPLDQEVVVSTDVQRRFLAPPSKLPWPLLVELSGDESMTLRAVRPTKDPAHPEVAAHATLPLAAIGDVDTDVELAGARFHLRARVREAP